MRVSVENPESFSVQILCCAPNWNPILGILYHVPQEVTFIFSSFQTETWTLSIGRNRLGLTLSIRSELHPKVSPKLFAGGGQYHPYLTKPDPVYDRKFGFSIPCLCIKYKDPYKAHPVYEKFC